MDLAGGGDRIPALAAHEILVPARRCHAVSSSFGCGPGLPMRPDCLRRWPSLACCGFSSFLRDVRHAQSHRCLRLRRGGRSRAVQYPSWHPRAAVRPGVWSSVVQPGVCASGCWCLDDAATPRHALADARTGGDGRRFLSWTIVPYYMWWGGWSVPARFLLPVLPLAAPMIAVAFDRCRGAASRGVSWLAVAGERRILRSRHLPARATVCCSTSGMDRDGSLRRSRAAWISRSCSRASLTRIG